MATIGLSFYSFRIFGENTSKNKLKYKILYGNNFNIGKLIYNELKNKAERFANDNLKEQVSRVDFAEINHHNLDDLYYFSSLKSIVKSGNYGVETEIIDSENGEKAFTQTKKQAGVKPFGFALYYSKDIRTGLLVTQSFGVHGISSLLKTELQSIIKQIDPELIVEIKSVTPKDYLEKLLTTSQISDICVEKYKKKKAHDLADDKNFLFDSSVIEMHYKNPLISDQKKFLEIITNRRPLNTELSFITSEEEEILNFKFECKVNGKSKKVSYNNYFSMRITEDITKEVTIDPNTGHPGRDSLFEIMDNISIWYLHTMNVVADNNNKEIKKHNIKLFTTEENDGTMKVKERLNGENILISI